MPPKLVISFWHCSDQITVGRNSAAVHACFSTNSAWEHGQKLISWIQYEYSVMQSEVSGVFFWLAATQPQKGEGLEPESLGFVSFRSGRYTENNSRGGGVSL
jgi:hypothetical protein